MKKTRRFIPLALLTLFSLFSLFPVFASAQQQQILCATNTPCGPTGPTNTLTGDQAPVAGYKINSNFTSLFNSVALLSVEYNVQNTAYAGGADPTGSADSTAAIQAAMTAACTVGGILKFPHGTYKVSSTLNGCNTGPFWVSIEGDAEYKSYINWTGATPTLAGVTITGTAGQFACSSCTNLAVGDTLTISGTYGGTGSITGYANPTQYRVSAVGTNTFTLQTLSHGALTTTAGTPTGLTYTPGQSVFYMLGWGSSTIRNITINIGSAPNVVGWDLDTDTTAQSMENLTFTNDLVQGTAVGDGGWRLGLSQDGTNDYSFINFENCSVHGNLGGAVAANSFGWLIEGPNALNINWFGGNAYAVATGFSDIGQAGHTYNGNASYAFYGWGTSGNTTDFLFNGGGQYQIYGGRFEMGQVFIDVSAYLASTQIIVSGAQVAAYTGASFSGNTGVVVELTGSVSMQMEGTKFEQGASPYTGSLITIATNNGPVFDNITFLDNTVDGSFPFYNVVGGNSGGAITIRAIGNVQKSHSGESAIALFPDVIPLSVAAVSTTGGTTNLTASQIGTSVVEVSGTLTSNATIVFPASSAWNGTLINATTGAYTMTFQTSGQTAPGTVVAQNGFVPAASDGTTLYSIGNSSNAWSGAQFFNNGIGVVGNLALTGSMTVNSGTINGPVYTIATLPTCAPGIIGAFASVSNGVSSPTYFGAVSTTGSSTDPVYCNYTGSTYGWVYH